jgi:Carboxypeptidase regulatory-like domain
VNHSIRETKIMKKLESSCSIAGHETCLSVPARVRSTDMFIKSLQIGFVALVLSIASAWAGSSSIQGLVKDAKGQPIKGADVRIESRDGKQHFNTAKTDAKGRYISEGLPAGVYRVTLVVNGAVKASIANSKTKSDQATLLNFDLTAAAAPKAKSGKHWVWVPADTGTHIGGRWVEVDESAKPEPGTLNVQKANADQLERAVHSSDAAGHP